MSRNEYWANPKIVREQAVMFAATLDGVVSADHLCGSLKADARRGFSRAGLVGVGVE